MIDFIENKFRNDKVGRNEQCPCGSGKKFKRCCFYNINKEIDKPNIRSSGHLQHLINQELEKNQIKECLHPESPNKCNGKPIVSHSIQRNGILTDIADDGHVIAFNGNKFFDEEGPIRELGVGKATTFKGFCNYHDTDTFKEIEKYKYKKTDQQNFLFAFRTISHEYFNKRMYENIIRNKFKKDPSLYNSNMFLEEYRKMLLEMSDINYLKSKFDTALLESDFSIIRSVVFKLDQNIKFSLTANFLPEYDLEGTQLNDIYSKSKDRLIPIFLTIFPQGKESYIIFSWVSEDEKYVNKYIEQLTNASDTELMNHINILVPRYIENFAINPKAWNDLNKSEKTTFFENFFSPNIGKREGDKVYSEYDYMVESKVDLFKL